MTDRRHIQLTAPDGAILWTGPETDFAATNEGRDRLIAAVAKLAPGESVTSFDACWFGDSVDGIAPGGSVITRVVERPASSIVGTIGKVALLLVGFFGLSGCDVCTAVAQIHLQRCGEGSAASCEWLADHEITAAGTCPAGTPL